MLRERQEKLNGRKPGCPRKVPGGCRALHFHPRRQVHQSPFYIQGFIFSQLFGILKIKIFFKKRRKTKHSSQGSSL